MTTPAIIISDHDEAYLDMMQLLLEEEGYPNVIGARSSDVLDLTRRQPVRLVFVDVSITRPDEGWQLISLLRLQPSTSAIPIIISSTDPRLPEAKGDLLQKMNCHFLEKPFELEALLAMLNQLIGPPGP